MHKIGNQKLSRSNGHQSSAEPPSALKFSLVPVLDPSGLKPGTEPVLIIGTGPVETCLPWSLPGSQTGFDWS